MTVLPPILSGEQGPLEKPSLLKLGTLGAGARLRFEKPKAEWNVVCV